MISQPLYTVMYIENSLNSGKLLPSKVGDNPELKSIKDEVQRLSRERVHHKLLVMEAVSIQ